MIHNVDQIRRRVVDSTKNDTNNHNITTDNNNHVVNHDNDTDLSSSEDSHDNTNAEETTIIAPGHELA